MNFKLKSIAAALVLSGTAYAETAIDFERIVVEGKYLSINESNSVKTPTPIIDVPQSLSIMTADEITLRGITSVGEIIDYTPGVNTSQGEGHRDSVVFRGVRSTADFYIDGNRDDVQYYRALYNIEQVEILRGPNALLFGRGGYYLCCRGKSSARIDVCPSYRAVGLVKKKRLGVDTERVS